MGLPFPEGTTALPTDHEIRSLQKIVQLVEENGGGGGGGSTQVFRSASSNPSADPGVSAAIHYREDNGAVWVWDNTNSQWDQILG